MKMMTLLRNFWKKLSFGIRPNFPYVDFKMDIMSYLLSIMGGKFQFNAQDSNLASFFFFGNGTKIKIPSEIKSHNFISKRENPKHMMTA